MGHDQDPAGWAGSFTQRVVPEALLCWPCVGVTVVTDTSLALPCWGSQSSGETVILCYH